MPSFKELRAIRKRESRRWHPAKHGLLGSRDILSIAAQACGAVLVTVPEKHSKLMPETETEKKWLDTFTYPADPHSLGDEDDKPRKPVTAADRAVWDQMQSPMFKAFFGISDHAGVSDHA